VSYVRADRAVTVDVFGDDEPEHLGANRAIEFTADTGVFVVVPPGGTGVGDRDGNADERSPGWGRQATRP
jgi:molybdopterin biosynthesis enzyme MoaB